MQNDSELSNIACKLNNFEFGFALSEKKPDFWRSLHTPKLFIALRRSRKIKGLNPYLLVSRLLYLNFHYQINHEKNSNRIGDVVWHC
jgi:hypothetical protein